MTPHAPRIEADMDLMLVFTRRPSLPVPARIAYEPDDPYAVYLTLTTGPSGECVEWIFARQLLLDGVVSPTGEGDVHVWPKHEADKSTTFISLTSLSGSALLEVSTGELAEFLTRTLREVPLGTEGRFLGLEEGLAALLIS